MSISTNEGSDYSTTTSGSEYSSEDTSTPSSSVSRSQYSSEDRSGYSSTISKSKYGSTLSRSPRHIDDGLGPKWKFWRRRRYILVILMFFGGINLFTIRANISAVITTMARRFDWDMETQGYVLSVFFYGTIFLPFAAGYASTKVGATTLIGVGIGVPAYISIFTEYYARAHIFVLMAMRFVEGALQSLAIVSSLGVWPVWIPPLECNRLMQFAYSGGYVGMLLTMLLSGPIIEKYKWGAVFVIFGAMGTLWYGLWLGLVYRSPLEDGFIHPKELKYLMDTLHPIVIIHKYPWRELFTSFAVYSVVVNQFAILWGQYTLTQMPMFLEDVLHLNIVYAGYISAMPYMILIVMMQVTGNTVYFILKRNYLSATHVRKIFICTGFLLEGLCLFFLGYTNSETIIISLIAGVALSAGLSESNFYPNMAEIAGPYASILSGISYTCGSLPGIICPIVTGHLVGNKTREEWMVIFMIAAGIYWFAAIFFFALGSGERQSWATIEEKKSEESEYGSF